MIKRLILLKIQNMMDIKEGLPSVVYKFFDKKSKGTGFKSAIKTEIKQKEQLAEELHKPIIRKFEKQKVNPSFKDNV